MQHGQPRGMRLTCCKHRSRGPFVPPDLAMA